MHKTQAKFDPDFQYYREDHDFRACESTYSELASSMYKQGKRSQALEIAEAYVQEYPESSYAHFYVGTRYLKEQLIELAEEQIGKALEIELSQFVPDSEKIFIYNLRMQEITEKKGKGR